MKYEQN